MAQAKYYPLIQRDPGVVYVDMGGTDYTAHIGDWLVFSGKKVVAADTATAYFQRSGIGIALDQNPKWTNQGSAYYLTAMPVGKAGVFRVSGVTGNYSAGQFVFPVIKGSGQVGQTGRTGQACVWSATAILPFRFQLISAPGGGGGSAWSGVPNSGVGRIMRVHASGATGQWDIEVFSNLFDVGGHY